MASLCHIPRKLPVGRTSQDNGKERGAAVTAGDAARVGMRVLVGDGGVVGVRAAVGLVVAVGDGGDVREGAKVAGGDKAGNGSCTTGAEVGA